MRNFRRPDIAFDRPIPLIIVIAQMRPDIALRQGLYNQRNEKRPDIAYS